MKNTLRVIILALILVTLAGCSLTKQGATTNNSTATNDFTDQDSAAVIATTKANLAKAQTAATSAHADASWIALNFKVPADLNPQSLTQTFVFGASSDPNNWFTDSIDVSGKSIRAIIPKSDFLGTDLQTIDQQYWKVGYVDALQTAYSNGGNAFMAQHPEAQITLTLSQGAPNSWLWYTITFQGSSGAQKIRISAFDGKIYDDQGNLVK